MEVLLADIVLMNEISILAEQVEAVADVFDHSPDMSSIRTKDLDPTTASGKALEVPSVQRSESAISDENISWGNVDMLKPALEGDSAATSKRASRRGSQTSGPEEMEFLKQNSSGGLATKDLLDQWEDPVEAANKKVRFLMNSNYCVISVAFHKL